MTPIDPTAPQPEAERMHGVTVIRCPECDAGEPCRLVRESAAIARPETGDGAGDAPSPMRDEPAPSSDDLHGACSRVLVGMAEERDKARASAAAASERHEDDLRRLLDCREVVRSLTAERDEARAAVAALEPYIAARIAADRERLAAAVEAAGRADVRFLAQSSTDILDAARAIGAEDAWKAALRIIRNQP